MNSTLKWGYFLFGTGFGLFIGCCLYERELNKPIGDVEEFVPEEDRQNENNTSKDEDDKDEETVHPMVSDSSVMKYYQTTSRDNDIVSDGDVRNNRENRNQRTRYSKMYDDINGIEDRLTEKLDKIARDKAIEIATDAFEEDEEVPEDDIPYEEDDTDPDSELVRERVENNIEIYLGENPQDFVTLIFYEGDNTLADDHEHIVPAADEVVGLVALSRLIEGGPGAENGTIFVRNLKTMINYEVVLDAGSYSETVLGIFDSHRNKGAGGDVDRQ